MLNIGISKEALRIQKYSEKYSERDSCNHIESKMHLQCSHIFTLCFWALVKINSIKDSDYNICIIGNALNEECHKKSHTRTSMMILLKDF